MRHTFIVQCVVISMRYMKGSYWSWLTRNNVTPRPRLYWAHAVLRWMAFHLNQCVTHCSSLCGIFLLHQTGMFKFVTPGSCWPKTSAHTNRLFPNKCYSIRVQFPSWSLKTRFTKHQQHEGFKYWYWFHFCRQDVDKVYMSSTVQCWTCTFLGKTRHHCTAVHQCKS